MPNRDIRPRKNPTARTVAAMRSARPAIFVLALLAALTLALISPTTAQAASSKSKGRSSVTVLTFNVCGNAAGCRNWDQRENAVVKRIVGSRPDVVNIQEGHGAIPKLEPRLARHGYVLAAYNNNEGIFAKASKIAPITITQNVTNCHYGRIYPDPSVNTDDWNATGPHTDENGIVWYPDNRRGVWYRGGDVCTTQAVQTTRSGDVPIAGRAGAAWAMLRVKKTNKTYLFVSTHLITGKSKNAARRTRETATLLQQTYRVAEGRPRIFAGDFNSSIQRGKDTVGKRFKSKGFTDAYTKTKSHTGAKYNSATGYGKKPRKGGSHIDRVFVPRTVKASHWVLDVKVRSKKNVTPIPSDHSPVRVTLTLP